jgi:hypothetical protein
MFINSTDLMAQRIRYDDLLRQAEQDRVLKGIHSAESRNFSPTTENRPARIRRLVAVLRGIRIEPVFRIQNESNGASRCCFCAA